MKITTTYTIADHVSDQTRGFLYINVFVNDSSTPSHSFVYMCGNIADIREFVAGDINEAEVERRWRQSANG